MLVVVVVVVLQVLMYNPATHRMSSSDRIPVDIDSGDHQWLGGVVVNDVVYGIPYSANKVLIFDPATNEVSSSATISTHIDTGIAQWVGGVVVGKVA